MSEPSVNVGEASASVSVVARSISSAEDEVEIRLTTRGNVGGTEGYDDFLHKASAVVTALWKNYGGGDDPGSAEELIERLDACYGARRP